MSGWHSMFQSNTSFYKNMLKSGKKTHHDGQRHVQLISKRILVIRVPTHSVEFAEKYINSAWKSMILDTIILMRNRIIVEYFLTSYEKNIWCFTIVKDIQLAKIYQHAHCTVNIRHRAVIVEMSCQLKSTISNKYSLTFIYCIPGDIYQRQLYYEIEAIVHRPPTRDPVPLLVYMAFFYLIETESCEWRKYASVNYPSLVQIIAWRLDGTKPLFEPMLEYC